MRVFALFWAASISLFAQTFQTVVNFDNTNGSKPYAPLVQGTNGGLYGTTLSSADGYGTAFELGPGGFQSFGICPGQGCVGAHGPEGGLVQASNGNFYGTSVSGGTYGAGTVYAMTPGGTFKVLHSFDGTDGEAPESTLVEAADGSFYGTTTGGGAYGHGGTIFRITAGGELSTLYSFCAQSTCPEGYFSPGVVQASDGNFYGTAYLGGGECSIGSSDCGTVFRMTPSGELTVIYHFCALPGCPDGAYPGSTLVQASDGNLYGTTQGGGAENCTYEFGCGTLFRISLTGELTTLYTFCLQSGCEDGSSPEGLIQGTDGNLYGVTDVGGLKGGTAYGGGTIFRITLGGQLTTLHQFCQQTNCADGASPLGALVQDTDGTFYGTTSGGGDSKDGTVFSLSVGLAPFVESQTASGKVGTAVNILGTDLTGATSVTFNGVSANFAGRSSSLIQATVPVGATSGKIVVVTPKGTLVSRAVFSVL